MCFKNLPIEFDDAGKAQLKAGVADPYSVTVAEPKGYVRRKEGPGAQLAAPPRLRDWNIDPMTRVAGALAVHTVLDLENRRAVDAHSRPRCSTTAPCTWACWPAPTTPPPWCR